MRCSIDSYSRPRKDNQWFLAMFMSELSERSSRFTSRKKRIWKKASFPGGRARTRPVRRLKAPSLDFRPSWAPTNSMGLMVIFDGSWSRPSWAPYSKPWFKLGAKISNLHFTSAHQILYNEQIRGLKNFKKKPLCLLYQDVFVAWILKITVKKGGLANGDEIWYNIVA